MTCVCGNCIGDGWLKVRRPTSGTRRSPKQLRCKICGGSGKLTDWVAIPLRAAQRTETFEQYHEDTRILQEFGITISERAIEGHPDKLRELAKLMAQDYDHETGFESVSLPLKREMLNAADRIVRHVGA